MKYKDVEWHIAIRRRPHSSILEDIETPFIIVPNPIMMWAADPFLIEQDGILFIFAELFSYKQWKGSIGYCKYESGRFVRFKCS